jgi:integrase
VAPADGAGSRHKRETGKVLTRLLNQVDEQRNPRTGATVNELLDTWLEVIDVERKTRTGYVSKIDKHIRLEMGRLVLTSAGRWRPASRK